MIHMRITNYDKTWDAETMPWAEAALTVRGGRSIENEAVDGTVAIVLEF